MASGVAPVAKHLPSKHQTPNSNPCTTKINSSTCSSAGAGFYGKTKSSYAMAGHSSKEVLPSAVCVLLTLPYCSHSVLPLLWVLAIH
jgi:hypothetical protein